VLGFNGLVLKRRCAFLCHILGRYQTIRRGIMIKVKTFTSPLKPFHIMGELNDLDEMVNQFIQDKKVQKIFSVSDAATTDNTGATIGVIRVVTYEQ
jgi:hypothetical protein